MALALGSVAPPAGPLAPRFSLKDVTVGYAESRTRTGPRGALCPRGHVPRDMLTVMAVDIFRGGASEKGEEHEHVVRDIFRGGASEKDEEHEHVVRDILRGGASEKYEEHEHVVRDIFERTHWLLRAGVGSALGVADSNVL